MTLSCKVFCGAMTMTMTIFKKNNNNSILDCKYAYELLNGDILELPNLQI